MQRQLRLLEQSEVASRVMPAGRRPRRWHGFRSSSRLNRRVRFAGASSALGLGSGLAAKVVARAPGVRGRRGSIEAQQGCWSPRAGMEWLAALAHGMVDPAPGSQHAGVRVLSLEIDVRVVDELLTRDPVLQATRRHFARIRRLCRLARTRPKRVHAERRARQRRIAGRAMAGRARCLFDLDRRCARCPSSDCHVEEFNGLPQTELERLHGMASQPSMGCSMWNS